MQCCSLVAFLQLPLLFSPTIREFLASELLWSVSAYETHVYTEHLQLWDTAPVYILDQLTCVVNIPPIVTVNLQLCREAETGASHSASNI